MSETYTHKCIKPDCSNTYTANDPDAYYCASCNERRKSIAAEVDKKLAGRVNRARAKSDYQIALEKGKVTGSGLFVRAGDLGIKF